MKIPPAQIAESIRFLASEDWSGNIMGQIVSIDSGKLGKIHWLREEC